MEPITINRPHVLKHLQDLMKLEGSKCSKHPEDVISHLLFVRLHELKSESQRIHHLAREILISRAGNPGYYANYQLIDAAYELAKSYFNYKLDPDKEAGLNDEKEYLISPIEKAIQLIRLFKPVAYAIADGPNTSFATDAAIIHVKEILSIISHNEPRARNYWLEVLATLETSDGGRLLLIPDEGATKATR